MLIIEKKLFQPYIIAIPMLTRYIDDHWFLWYNGEPHNVITLQLYAGGMYPLEAY